MSIDIALKVGVGLLGAASVSLGGYELHNYLTSTLESKYSLLSETDSKWDQLANKYKETSQTPEKMEGLTSTEENQVDLKNKLIEHCRLILKTSLRENSETLQKREKEIKDWCVEDATALKQ